MQLARLLLLSNVCVVIATAAFTIAGKLPLQRVVPVALASLLGVNLAVLLGRWLKSRRSK